MNLDDYMDKREPVCPHYERCNPVENNRESELCYKPLKNMHESYITCGYYEEIERERRAELLGDKE